jgi:hypothetical protein
MAVIKTTRVDTGDNGYNGQVLMARGQDVLGAGGSVNVSVPGFPAGATAIATYDTSTAGPTGLLAAGYTAGSGILQIASTAGAGDAGEVVNWVLLA